MSAYIISITYKHQFTHEQIIVPNNRKVADAISGIQATRKVANPFLSTHMLNTVNNRKEMNSIYIQNTQYMYSVHTQ